jgi:hypothetical protein
VIDERAVEIWNDELEELFLRTGHRFRRVEPRRRMNTPDTAHPTAFSGSSTAPAGTPTSSATTSSTT